MSQRFSERPAWNDPFYDSDDEDYTTGDPSPNADVPLEEIANGDDKVGSDDEDDWAPYDGGAVVIPKELQVPNVRLVILCGMNGTLTVPSSSDPDYDGRAFTMGEMEIKDQKQALLDNHDQVSTGIFESKAVPITMLDIVNKNWHFQGEGVASSEVDPYALMKLFFNKKWNKSRGLHFDVISVGDRGHMTVEEALAIGEASLGTASEHMFAVSVFDTFGEEPKTVVVMCSQARDGTVAESLIRLEQHSEALKVASGDANPRLTRVPISTGEAATCGLMGRFVENVLQHVSGTLKKTTNILDRLTRAYGDMMSVSDFNRQLGLAAKGILELPVKLSQHGGVEFIPPNNEYANALPSLMSALDGEGKAGKREVTIMRTAFTKIGFRLKVKLALSSYIMRCMGNQFADHDEACIALLKEISIGFSQPVDHMYAGIILHGSELNGKYVVDGERGYESREMKRDRIMDGTPLFTDGAYPELFTQDDLSKISNETVILRSGNTRVDESHILDKITGSDGVGYDVVHLGEILKSRMIQKVRSGGLIDTTSRGAGKYISMRFPKEHVPYYPGLPNPYHPHEKVDAVLLHSEIGDIIRIVDVEMTHSDVQLPVSAVQHGAALQSYSVSAVAFTIMHRDTYAGYTEQRRFWNALGSMTKATIVRGGEADNTTHFVRIPKGPVETVRTYRTKTVDGHLESDFLGTPRKFCQIIILLYESLSAMVLAEADEYRKLSLSMCGKIIDGGPFVHRQPLGCAAKPYSSSWKFTLPSVITDCTMEEVCYTLVTSLYVVHALTGTISETEDSFLRFYDYANKSDGSRMSTGSELLSTIIKKLKGPELLLSPLNYVAPDNTQAGMRSRNPGHDGDVATQKVMDIMRYLHSTSQEEYFGYDDAFMYSGDIVAISSLGRSILDRILSDVMEPGATSLKSVVAATYQPNLQASLPGEMIGPLSRRAHCIAQLVRGTNSNLLIFGIRGTNPRDPVDLWTDSELTNGRLETTDRFNYAQQALVAAIEVISNMELGVPLEIMLVGHSLGGSIAARLRVPKADIIAPLIISNVMIVTFARGGGPSMNVPIANNEVPLRNIGDPISLPSKDESINLGKMTFSTFFTKVFGLKAHSMDSFADNYFIAPSQ